MLENITTEPHVHGISADVVRVWLSGYILQQYVCMHMRVYTHGTCACLHFRAHAMVLYMRYIHKHAQARIHTRRLGTHLRRL
jgi:hypothetical protein